ncbi:hypothetical protein EV421DRAFT_1689899, partial [Armillaria borealis]
PVGLIWQNNSCAYDCVLTVLCQIWKEDVNLWSNMFAEVNTDWLGRLSNMLRRYTAGLTSFENVRDELRQKYAILDPVHMRYGSFTYVSKVLQPLFLNDRPVRSSIIVCSSINDGILEETMSFYSIRDWVSHDSWERQGSRCSACGAVTHRRYNWNMLPNLLAFSLSGTQHELREIDTEFTLADVHTVRKTYKLRGIIYHSGNHFTA